MKRFISKSNFSACTIMLIVKESAKLQTFFNMADVPDKFMQRLINILELIYTVQELKLTKGITLAP